MTTITPWTSVIGGTANPSNRFNFGANDAKVGSDGSYYTYISTTASSGNMDFMNASGTQHATNTLTAFSTGIVKYNSQGVIQWVVRATSSTSGANYFTSLELDSSDNVYLTGFFDATLTITDASGAVSTISKPVNAGLYYSPIIKLNSAGIWQFGFVPVNGTSTFESGLYCLKTVGTDLYAVIMMSGNANALRNRDGTTFRSLTSAVGSETPVLVKFNSTGACQYAFQLFNSASDHSRMHGMDIDTAGNIYINGVLRTSTRTYIINDISGTISEKASIHRATSTAATDGVILCYNSSGVAQWAVSMTASSTNDIGRSLVANSSGTFATFQTNSGTGAVTVTKQTSSGTTTLATLSSPAFSSNFSYVIVNITAAGNWGGYMAGIPDASSKIFAGQIYKNSSGSLFVTFGCDNDCKFYDICGSSTSLACGTGNSVTSGIIRLSSTGRYLTHRIVQGTNQMPSEAMAPHVAVDTNGTAFMTTPIGQPTTNCVSLAGKVLSIVFKLSSVSGSWQRLIDFNNGGTSAYLFIAPTFNSNGSFRMGLKLGGAEVSFTTSSAIFNTTSTFIVNIFFDTSSVSASVGTVSGSTITYLDINGVGNKTASLTYAAANNNVAITRENALVQFSRTFFGLSAYGTGDGYLNATYYKISSITPPSSTTYYTDTNLSTFVNMALSNTFTTGASGRRYIFNNGTSTISVMARATTTVDVSGITISPANSAYFDTMAQPLAILDTTGSTVVSQGPSAGLARHIGTYGTMVSRTSILAGPLAITNLSVTITSQTTATLTWTAPDDNGSVITSYKVFYGSTELTGTSTPAVSVSGTTATLTSCAVGQPYSLTVRAVNAAGTANASNIISLMTGVPATLPAGAVLWYDAADVNTVTTTSGNVTSWTNKGSRTGNNLVASSGNVTVGSIASKTALTHAAGTNLTLISNGMGNASTQLVVWRVNSLNTNQYITALHTWNTGGTGFLLDRNSTNVLSIGDGPNGVFGATVARGIPEMVNRVSMVTSVLGTTSQNYIGVDGTSRALNIENRNMASGTTGSTTWFTNASGYGTSHDLAEVIFYTSALSAEDRQKAEGYLAWKWGLQESLPSTHQYKSANVLPVVSNLAATPTSATSVTLSWDGLAPNGYGNIISYTVTATPSGGSTTTYNITGLNVAYEAARTYTITGLNAGTSYTYTVTATSIYGSSTAASITASTSTAPSAPAKPSVVAGNKRATLTWGPPSDGGSAITGYTIIKYKGGVNVGSVDASGGDTSKEITDLSNGAIYTFTIAATNNAGTSSYSVASDDVTPNALPSGIITLTGLTRVGRQVATNTALLVDEDGLPANFRYQWQLSDTSGGTFSNITDASGSLYTPVLADMGKYLRAVVEYTDLTNSVESVNSAASLITAGVPAVPTGVSATAGYLRATVSWTPPATANGSAIISYTVQSSILVNQALQSSTRTVSDLSATSFEFTGLTAGLSYAFSVRANNEIGSSSYSSSNSNVTPYTVPTAPQSVTAIASYDSVPKITVGWSEPDASGGSAVTGYRITVGGVTPYELSANVFSYEFSTGLTPGQEYSYTVAARNAADYGSESNPAATATPFTKPGVPQNVVAVAGYDGGAEITLSWGGPTEDGYTTITEYRITDISSGETYDILADTETYLFTGLIENTSYRYTVTARNAAGLGNPSGIATGSTYGPPSAPAPATAVAGNEQITVSWTDASANGSAIQSYRIYYEIDSTTTIIDVSANVTSVDISGLTNGTPYTFYVSAKNDAEFGLAAVADTATPRTVPGAPSGITPTVVVTTGGGKISLSWSAPEDTGGAAIDDYKITTLDVSSGDVIRDISLGSTATPYLVSGLTNGVEYKFQIAAHNEAGWGAPDESAEITPYTYPGTVMDLSAADGYGKVTLTWTVPADNGNAITSFVVYYTDISSSITGTYAEGDSVSTEINLDASSGDYTFTVRAVNDAGLAEVESNPAAAQSYGAPDAPISFTCAIGEEQNTLTWVAPTETGYREVSHYLIEFTIDGGVDMSFNVGATDTSYNHTGLNAGTTYTYYISTVTVDGLVSTQEGPALGMPYTTPGVPTGVSVTSGNQSVSVSWSAPDYLGDADLSGYNVRLTDQSGAQTTEYLDGSGLSIDISGLTNGYSYTVEVATRNIYLTSDYSAPTDAETPSRAPDAPTNVQATAKSHAVDLTWNAPAYDGGAAIEGYYIYDISDIATPIKTTVGTGISGEVTDLSNGRAYIFKVRAYNARDSGALSAVSNTVYPNAPLQGSIEISGNFEQGQTLNIVSTVTDADGISGEFNYQWAASSNGSSFTDISGATANTFTLGQENVGKYIRVTVRYTDLTGTGEMTTSAAVGPVNNTNDSGSGLAITGTAAYDTTLTADTTNLSDTDGLPLSSTYSYQWFKNTGSGSDSTITGASGETLTIGRDEVNYKIRVRVSYTDSLGGNEAVYSAYTDIIPAFKPTVPTLRGVHGNGSVSLEWDAPEWDGGSALTSYKIYQNGNLIVTRPLIDGTSYGISGLTNGQAYSYTITAVNAVPLESDASNTKSLTPGAPPSAVRDLSGTYASQQVTLTWSAPDSSGGYAISGYKVYTEDVYETTVTGTTVTINSLVNGTAYTFGVAAYNDISEGPVSTMAVTPSTVPSAPASVSVMEIYTNGPAARVSWSAPASDGGAAVTGYRVRLAGSATVYADLSADVSSAVIEGLVATQTYRYVVFAYNKNGESATSADPGSSITAFGLPSAPTGLTLTHGDGTVGVSWTAAAANGESVDQYKVAYGVSSEIVSSGTSTTISGLTNGTTYTFTVTAFNAAGEGTGVSGEEYPSTKPDAPVASIGGYSDGSVQITWAGPLANGGAAITAYTVWNSSSNTEIITLPANTFSYTHNGRTNGVEYSYYVKAHNRSGSSDPSYTVSETPRTLPGTVQNFTVTGHGSDSVSFSWSAPASDGGAAIDAYYLYVDGMRSTPDISASATSYTKTGLTNGTTYTFTLKAHNSEGVSSSASAAPTEKPSTVPGTPASITTTPQDGGMRVAWTAPTSLGGAIITEYLIEWADLSATVAAADTSYNITGLTNGTSYTFSVKARNRDGYSTVPRTATASPGRVPLAPYDLSATNYGYRSVDLLWLHEDLSSGRDLEYYYVDIYDNSSGVLVTSRPVLPSSKTTTINSLTNATTYKFRVRAKNERGSSAASDYVVETPRWVPDIPDIALTHGDKSMRIDWSNTNTSGYPITGYKIYVDNVLTADNIPSTSTNYTITGLTNGQTYTFKLVVTNAVGSSEESGSSYPSRKPNAPAAPSVTRPDKISGSLTINWSLDISNNGHPIEEFKIYRATAADGIYENITTVSQNTSSWENTELVNGRMYYYKISAVNTRDGESDKSAASNGEKPSASPSTPTGLAATAYGDKSITLSWNATTSNGDAVTYYLYRSTNPNSFVTVDWSGSELTRTNAGAHLVNGITYYFKVLAENRDGMSGMSATASEYPSTVPDAPAATVTHGNQELQIAWSAPDSSGGAAITAYEVWDSSSNTRITTTSANTFNYTRNGLTNGVEYSHYVTAHNRSGASNPSITVRETPSAAPGKPVNLAVQRSPGQFVLTWDVSDNGYPITTREVYNASTGIQITTGITISGDSATITGLLIGPEYSFKVRAENRDGYGVLSDASAKAEMLTYPGMPSNVLAIKGDSIVQLTWLTHMMYTGGTIVSNISYRVYSADGLTPYTIQSADENGCTVTGLTNGTAYRFTVKAYNGVAESINGSSPTTAVTPGTPDVATVGETFVRVDATTNTTFMGGVVAPDPSTPGTATYVPSRPDVYPTVSISNIPAGINVTRLVIATSPPVIVPNTVNKSVILDLKMFSGDTPVTTFPTPVTVIVNIPGMTAATVDVRYRATENDAYVFFGTATKITDYFYSFTTDHFSDYEMTEKKPIPCIVEGTRVLTQGGYKAVETLKRSDRIVTSDGKAVQFLMLRTTVANATPSTAPYMIPAHCFGHNSPPAPVTLSGHHAIQIRRGVWHFPAALAKIHSGIKQVGLGETVTYYHIKLPNYLSDNLVVEGGAVLESLGGKKYSDVSKVYSYSARLGGYTRVNAAQFDRIHHA